MHLDDARSCPTVGDNDYQLHPTLGPEEARANPPTQALQGGLPVQGGGVKKKWVTCRLGWPDQGQPRSGGSTEGPLRRAWGMGGGAVFKGTHQPLRCSPCPALKAAVQNFPPDPHPAPSHPECMCTDKPWL